MAGLTTHVLDTSQGKPAGGIEVQLFKMSQHRELLCTMQTNNDGRTDQPLLNAENFQQGTYELQFAVADYFRTANVAANEPPFLDLVTLRFTISENSHYHVPLLVSPWSYSTYRGS